MRKSLIVVAVCCAISACVPLPSKQDISDFLTKLNNANTQDFLTAEKVALAAVPPDTAGYNCAAALLAQKNVVGNVIQAVKGGTIGPITTAEMATLIIPGSPQMNSIRDAIVGGCAVKVAQVSSEIAGTPGWFAQLAVLFPFLS